MIIILDAVVEHLLASRGITKIGDMAIFYQVTGNAKAA